MIADTVTVVDGQTYQPGEEIWDLGSLQCIAVHGNRRDYQGFIQDVNKLPKYKNLGTGSMAELLDPTGQQKVLIAKYDNPTKQWINYLKGGVVV